MFRDGRATGLIPGDPLAEQAQGPFLNPKERALLDAEAVVALVCASTYAGLFLQVWVYDTRDVLPTCQGAYTEAQALAADCWPAPEHPANMNTGTSEQRCSRASSSAC